MFTEEILNKSQEWKDWIDPSDKLIIVFDIHRADPKDESAYRTFIVVTKNGHGLYTVTRFFPLGENIMVSVDHNCLDVIELINVLLTKYSSAIK